MKIPSANTKPRTKQSKRRTAVVIACAIALVVGVGNMAANLVMSKQVSASFPQLHSASDKDGDGVDDQVDILNEARAYVAGNPRYESKYYASGYPDDNCGVCTDVVAFALKNSGYDLRELIGNDIKRALRPMASRRPTTTSISAVFKTNEYISRGKPSPSQRTPNHGAIGKVEISSYSKIMSASYPTSETGKADRF